MSGAADDSLSVGSVSLSGGSDELEDVCGGGQEERAFDDFYNILLVGDSGVGKTDLIGRLTEDEFKTKFHATIGISVESRTLEIDGRIARLQILDPSGSNRFRSVIKQYFQNAKGIMFVYDVTYKNSFRSIQDWIREIEKDIPPDVQRILVGNKCDVPVDIEQRVSFQEAEALAQSLGIKFFETSTINGQNVRRAFLTLCQEMKRKMHSPPSSGLPSASLPTSAGNIGSTSR